MRRVVCNSTPLIALGNIGRAGLLCVAYGRISDTNDARTFPGTGIVAVRHKVAMECATPMRPGVS